MYSSFNTYSSMPKGAGYFSTDALNVPILPIFIIRPEASKKCVIGRKNNPDKQMALNTSAPNPLDA